MGRLKTTHRMPLDVIIEILVWLPAKSALRFMSVCKEWCNLINSPLFAKLHLNKSLQPDSQHNHALVFTHFLGIIEDLYHPSRWTVLKWPKDTIRDNDSRKVVGSCNGLVCYKVIDTAINEPDDTVRSFFICNPTTRTFKSILPCSEKKWKDNRLTYGFGYDNEHDDYKIVVTSTVWTTDSDRDVLIFSLKADLWSCPPPPPPPSHPRVSTGRIWINRKKVIFREKMLHYLAETADDGRSEVSKDYRIACFDVVSEKWRDYLCFPAQLKKDHVKLGELDGLLYLRGGSYKSEVWMLEEHGSWKKMFQIPKNFWCNHLTASSKDGHNRLLIEDPTGGYINYKHRDVHFWYDRREKRRIPFKVEPSPLYASVRPYIASLVTIPGCSLTKLQEIKK